MPTDEDVSQEFATCAAPVAPYTWDIGPVTLLNTDQESGIVPVRFGRWIEITGFDATVIPKLPIAPGSGLVIPTVDDLDVLIDMNQGDHFTAQVDDDGPQTGFVPLKSLLTQLPRLVRIRPGVPAPDFSIKFAWRQFVQGTPLYEHAIIDLTMFARYLPKPADGG